MDQSHCYENHDLKNHVSTCINFRDFPNEVVEKIMNYMEPDDLAVFSLTNTKYEILAKDHFNRKRKFGKVTIRVEETIHFDLEDQPLYVKRFKNLIRSVNVRFHGNSSEKATQFINKFCQMELHKLKLDNWTGMDLRMSEASGDTIKGHLSSLMRLEIDRLRFVDLYDVLLKHTNHLKTLALVGVESKSNNWMNRNYPELKILLYHSLNGSPIDEIFFPNNPQLKCVYLRQTNLAGLLLTETFLPYAVLDFSVIDSLNNLFALEICCLKKCIKSLELKAPNNHINAIELLRFVMPFKYIEALHCFVDRDVLEYFQEMIIARDYHPNIKRLCLYLSREISIRPIMKTIATLFPNLCELRIDSIGNGEDFEKSLTPIFRKLKMLKDIHITLKRDSFSEGAISVLASARSTLENASPVTIHLRSDCSMEPWPVVNDLVMINFENGTHCAICDIRTDFTNIERFMAKVMEIL